VITEADRRAEAALEAVLREERPGDAVTGEEGATIGGTGGGADAGRHWLLDPVDGTLNYASGQPAWCSAVALVQGGAPLVSAIYDPVHDELWSTAHEEGATCNGARLQVATPPRSLAAATVAAFVDARRRDPGIVAGTDALTRRVGALRALGCGSLELAWVAAGRWHGFSQADAEPWDWYPGALLVAEAGGAVGVCGRWHVAASDAALRDELLDCLGA